MNIVEDLIDWPPSITGGPCRRGSIFPTNAEDVAVNDVMLVAGNRVDFTGKFEGEDFPYSSLAPDEVTAEWLATVLRGHKAKSLLSVGIIAVPEAIFKRSKH